MTQATWLALVEHVTAINDPARVAGWLATTARREAVRVLRDGKRRVPFGDDILESESTDAPPGDALIRSERDRALWHGFAQLRPSDQELLKLTMADPRPAYQDISVALGMPVGSIGPNAAAGARATAPRARSPGKLEPAGRVIGVGDVRRADSH